MDLYGALHRLSFGKLPEPPPVVTVLRLSGVIGGVGPLRGGLNLAGLAPAIERAFKVPRLKAVALQINSPGGSPVQSALIAKRLRDLAREKELPVLAFCEDVAASGGYWLACAADEVYADASSIVGSIGVVSSGFGFQEAIKRLGVERRIHTAGDKKVLLDPFRDEDPKDVARLKAIHREIHQTFIDLVKERRGARLKGAEKALFSGEFWTGSQALELGLIDGLGDLRSVLRARFGEKVVLRPVQVERPKWRRLLGLQLSMEGGAHLDGLAGGAGERFAAGLIAAAEERLLWSRFGL